MCVQETSSTAERLPDPTVVRALLGSRTQPFRLVARLLAGVNDWEGRNHETVWLDGPARRVRRGSVNTRSGRCDRAGGRVATAAVRSGQRAALDGTGAGPGRGPGRLGRRFRDHAEDARRGRCRGDRAADLRARKCGLWALALRATVPRA